MARFQSPLRWLVTLAALLLVLALALRPSLERSISEPEAPAQPSTPELTEAPGSIDEEPLPKLRSLAEVDLDQAPARRQLDLQHWTTVQGARVYFMRADELPMLDVRLTFAAGASRDEDLPGLATLTNAMLNEGTGERDAGSIAAGFEQLGAEFENSAHRDMAIAGLRSLTAEDKLTPALDLFTAVVARPSFPEEALERLRDQMLAGLRFRLQRPSALASEAFWTDLYPAHPYGTLPQGQAESLVQIDREQLREFHQRYYSAGNAVIALVGAIDREQAERIARRIAEALPQGRAASPIADPFPIEPGHRHIDFDSQQTHILLGQHGISRNDPDYAALYVGNQILGGSGFGSRLMEQIRETRGLSYSVSSSLVPMQAKGPFMISMQTRADQVELALEVIHDSLDQFIEIGPSEAELQRTKRQIMGEFALSTASNAAIVGQLGMLGFYDLPLNHLQLFLERVQALSVEDVRAAFARHFDPENRLVVTVGPTHDEAQTETPTETAEQEPEA